MKKSRISDIVNVERGRDNPILLNFQNAEMGYKNDNTIQCFRALDVNRAVHEDEPGAKSSRMAVVISDQHAYRGYVGEGTSSNLMNTFVAVRNKKSGKMRLIQLEECSMLNACYDDNKNKFQEQESSLTVMRKFGGKVAIRALERLERSASNLDVLNDTIQDTVHKYDDDKFDDDAEFTKNKVEGELILASIKPPRNPEAKNTSEVYLLKQMMPETMLHHLKSVAFELMQKNPESLELANVYLTNKVKAALQSKEPDSEENIRTLKICLYMDALCRLFQLRGQDLTKAKVSPFSKQLEMSIKENFSQINHHQKTKTKYSVHKAISYYLAFAFMLENGVLNVDQIHAGLNIMKNEFLKFASFIGGSFNSTNNTLTLRLNATEGTSGRSFIRRKRFK